MEYRSVLEIHTLDTNPRSIESEDFSKLCASIYNNPKHLEAKPIILSDRTGVLVAICGNQRLEAARFLGMKEVPTFLMKGITEEKERELILRDNTSAGEWDEEILKEWDNKDLADFGLDVFVDFETEETEEDFEETKNEEDELVSVICPYCGTEFKI